MPWQADELRVSVAFQPKKPQDMGSGHPARPPFLYPIFIPGHVSVFEGSSRGMEVLIKHRPVAGVILILSLNSKISFCLTVGFQQEVSEKSLKEQIAGGNQSVHEDAFDSLVLALPISVLKQNSQYIGDYVIKSAQGRWLGNVSGWVGTGLV